MFVLIIPRPCGQFPLCSNLILSQLSPTGQLLVLSIHHLCGQFPLCSYLILSKLSASGHLLVLLIPQFPLPSARQPGSVENPSVDWAVSPLF